MTKKRKYYVECPFCDNPIELLYTTETYIKRKRGKTKIRTIKTPIGVDYNTHTKTCREYQDFLKK